MAKWIEKEKNEGEMIVTLSGNRWANAKIAAMNVLKRAGKEMTDENIVEAALNSCLDDMFANGLKELDLTPATLPDIEVRNVASDSVTVCFALALKPEVTLGDYSGITYKEEQVEVTGNEQEDAKQKMLVLQKAEAEMLDQLLEVTQLDLPKRMIYSEISGMLNTLASVLANNKMTLKGYLEEKGQSEDELIQELWPSAEKKVKISLALGQVAKQEQLSPSNSEIEGEYKAIALRGNVSVEQAKQIIPVQQLSYEMLLAKTMNYLKHLND